MSESHPKPSNSTDAINLMKGCIQRFDFEGAKYYYSQIDYLKNFEKTKQLSETVANYMNKKTEIADAVFTNIDQYSEEILKTKKLVQVEYQNKYKQLKEKNKKELDKLIEQWTFERANVDDITEKQYHQAMATARLIASSYNFDTAIKLKQEAERYRKEGNKQSFEEIDKKYYSNAKAMISRQKTEIEHLKNTMDIDLDLFDQLIDAAHDEALDNFFEMNGKELMNIIENYPNQEAIPTSLRLQIMKATPIDRGVRTTTPKQYKRFVDKMGATMKNLGI